MVAWTEFEAQILFWIQQNLRLGGIMDEKIVPGISALNDNGRFAIMLVIFFVLFHKYRNVGLTMMVSLASEFAIVSLVLKPLISRTRPYDEEAFKEFLQTIHSKVNPGENSFPSGHTGTMFAVAIVMLLCMIKYNFSKIITICTVVLAFMIAFSRLYMGEHYPTDVLTAMLIGTVTSFVSVIFVYKPATEFCEKLDKKKNENNVAS